jgi:hypothetical protein
MLSFFEQNSLQLIRRQFLGIKLKTNINGDAGRDFEDKMEEIGFPINRLCGIDMPYLGWEIKTRKESATSAQTITAMHPDDIIKTPYKLSPVYEKFKKQLRVYTNDYDEITKINVFNFDIDRIQCIIESSYERARSLLILNKNINYTPYEGICVFFEKTHKNRPELDIRISDTAIRKIELMSTSNYSNIFE